ncbi:MAG: hypothetical protein IPK82_11315 [Polyangiaceae bacterium]|nr:hypothetical protein [Polyangiaceae bacterium]
MTRTFAKVQTRSNEPSDLGAPRAPAMCTQKSAGHTACAATGRVVYATTSRVAYTALLALGVASCGGAPAPAAAPAASASTKPAASASGKADAKKAKSMDPPGVASMVAGSWLVPELMPEKGVFLREDGHKKMLVDRMRVIAYEDGSIERAQELMPTAYASGMALPSRLGGGFLFHSSNGGSTHLWRASSWLGHMEPLAQISPGAEEIVVGFDRLYLRLPSNRLSAIDPNTGEILALGPLPPAVSYGSLAFADGWRAVVDTDLRGPLVTFDAGTTWRPLNLLERATTITAITGDPTVFVPSGRYVVDASGIVRFTPNAPRVHTTDRDKDNDVKLAAPPGPLGKKPLRAALEDGFPEEGRSAIVARGGALARVSLRDGSVMRVVTDAYRDREASCHAVRLEKGWGFICGEHEGRTSVLAFVPPFSVKEVWQFDKPRYVAASGNGALVARGACSDEPGAAQPGGRAYCIRGVDGSTKQVRVTGDLGVERVIALADGRVVVLVPPRRESGGQITVLRGTAVESNAALKLPAKPADGARVAKRGMWLDGFEEREPGVVGGWVESGGATVGVRIALNGDVTVGEMRADSNGVVVSGRFGISIADDGEAAESSDGGMTWNAFELPDHEIESPSRTRACGPAGCAIANWLRVGWGKTLLEDDFAIAKSPSLSHVPMRTASTVTVACELLGSVTPPLPPKPAPKTTAATQPTPPRYPYGYGYGHGYGYYRAQPQWANFRNTAAPALGKDEVGVDTGTYGDYAAQLRSYAWGKKGSDWTKVGKWLVRFDDRYDAGGGVRASAVTTSPWGDETSAMSGVGGMTYGMLGWTSFTDPSGRATLGQACNGPCALYSLVEGQSPLALRDASGKPGNFTRLITPPGGTSGAAVRVGESWFFLTQGNSYDAIALWRADLGVVRQLGTYFRPVRRYSAPEVPRLVRRATGTGLGLLVTQPRGPGEASSTWFVLPVDPTTGAIEDPVYLGRRDLEGKMPERCQSGQNGWLVETALEVTPAVSIDSAYAALDGIEWRLRMDPGSVCVEGIAARVEGVVVSQKKLVGRPKEVLSNKVPLAATERSTGTRWVLQCGNEVESQAKGAVPPAAVGRLVSEDDPD